MAEYFLNLKTLNEIIYLYLIITGILLNTRINFVKNLIQFRAESICAKFSEKIHVIVGHS